MRSVEQTIVQAQELLDSGRPFHAHEVFEDAWKSARDRGADDAELWKSLAQLAVGLTHRLRGRPEGADRLLRRGAQGLRPFAVDPPHGVDVAGLIAWAAVPHTSDPPRLR